MASWMKSHVKSLQVPLRNRPGDWSLLFATAIMVAPGLAAGGHPALIEKVVDATAFEQACAGGVADVEGRIARLERDQRLNLFVEWNLISAAMEDLSGPASMMVHVHPDKALRDAAEACERRLSSLNTRLFQSAVLFRRLRTAKPADRWQAKLRRDLIDQFEDAGVGLPPPKRQRAGEIAERLVELGHSFERNLRDIDTRVSFSPEEMAGLPEDYLRSHAANRDAEGRYVLEVRAASYTPFLRQARDEAARKRFYQAAESRGGQANLDVLGEMTRLRQELARLHGLPSYAHLALRRRMVKDPVALRRFLAEAREAIAVAERRDVEELRQAKAVELGVPVQQVELKRWDVDYYQHKIRRDRFKVDQESRNGRFPVDRAVEFSMALARRLFGVEFRAAEAPTWHSDVRYFEVLESDRGPVRAGLYLDLFPRENKVRGGVMFPLRSASTMARRAPLCAIVLSLPGKDLTPGQIGVLMHEFGHALHCALSDARHVAHGGLNVKLDFVEVPSTVLQALAQKEQTWRLLKEVCPECPALTNGQIEQLAAERRYGQGIDNADEWLRSAFDLELSSGTQPPLEVWQRLESQTLLGLTEGTLHPASFRHIVSGMTAGYYTYLWSDMLAADLLTAFQHDALDERVGHRFRRAVLAQGGQQEEMTMVRNFLGREPSRGPWLADLASKNVPHKASKLGR